MRANEEGVVVQNLCPRRFIVSVVQADQRIAEKRRKLAARRFQLRRRGRSTNEFRQICPYLQLRMTAGVDNGRPRALFISSENGTGHFEFPESFSHGKNTVSDRGPVRHFRQSIKEPEERIEGGQALIVQD